MDPLEPHEIPDRLTVFTGRGGLPAMRVQTASSTVEIHDPALQRMIRIRKSGSNSTVIWNPWIEKSHHMPDFGDHEYLRMVCVESGNIDEHAITLAAGASSTLMVAVMSTPLA